MFEFLKKLFGIGAQQEPAPPPQPAAPPSPPPPPRSEQTAPAPTDHETAPEPAAEEPAPPAEQTAAPAPPPPPEPPRETKPSRKKAKTSMKTALKADYVIIGAGPAGVVAAETLREQDPQGSVLLISGEEEPPYSRMAIPYVLTGLIEEPGTYLRKTDNFYKDRSIDVHHAQVTGIDIDAKALTLADGGTCTYSRLLISTGASPIRPPVEGLDLPGVHHCWTLEDARTIVKLAGEGSKVVLMGAGFIGCIILEALAERGTELTVVEAENRMVPRMMNQTAGDLIKQWCEAKGMAVHTSTRVTRLTEQDGGIGVEMDNGETTTADLVVVATGVASNTSFLEGSGVEVNTGIRVNDRLESSVPGIFAAGDCAEGPDFSTGGWSVHAVQPTATDHGRIAALNMTGKDARYQGSVNMNVLDTVGLISSSFGQWQGTDGGELAEALDADRFRYTQLAFDGNHLIGALTLGRTDNIGILRGLIQSRTDLGVWKDRLMENPNRITEAYIANTQPHG